MSEEDAAEFLMAGASAVQVGTATFLNPNAPLEVIDGLLAFLQRARVEAVGEIIGVALPDRVGPTRAGHEAPSGVHMHA